MNQQLRSKACPSLCTDPLKFKALFVLAFPEFVMVGHAEAWSGIPGVDSAAKKELRVMRDNDFEPSQTLTMRKLNGRCHNSELLEQHVNSVFSTQSVHTKTLHIYRSNKTAHRMESMMEFVSYGTMPIGERGDGQQLVAA